MKVYNLEEFATKYNLKDIYGAYAVTIPKKRCHI